jgi:enterobactin synthetase component D
MKKYSNNFLKPTRISDFFLPALDRAIGAISKVHFESVKFRIKNYSDELFEQVGVSFPKSLKNAVIKRKAEYLAGRWCAQKVLKKLGIKDIDIHADCNRCPKWPEGIMGSITHCDNIAICAATQIRSDFAYIGIDLEVIPSRSTLQGVQTLILTPHEIMRIRSQSYLEGIDESTATMLIFSAKESFFKAIYPKVQAYFGFEVLEFVNWNWNAQKINFFVHRELISDVWLQDFISIRFYICQRRIFTLLFELVS